MPTHEIEPKEWFGVTTAGLLLSITVADIGRPEVLKRLAAIYNKFSFEANNIVSATARIIRYKNVKGSWFIHGLDKGVAESVLASRLHETIACVNCLDLSNKILLPAERDDADALIYATQIETEIVHWLHSAIQAKHRACLRTIREQGWKYGANRRPPGIDPDAFEYAKWKNGE